MKPLLLNKYYHSKIDENTYLKTMCRRKKIKLLKITRKEQAGKMQCIVCTKEHIKLLSVYSTKFTQAKHKEKLLQNSVVHLYKHFYNGRFCSPGKDQGTEV